eukprot:1897483-Pyramimonas_sp.AAC.2
MQEALQLIDNYGVTPTSHFPQRQVFSHTPKRVRRTLASSGAIPQPCPRQKVDATTGQVSKKRVSSSRNLIDIDEDEHSVETKYRLRVYRNETVMLSMRKAWDRSQ